MFVKLTPDMEGGLPQNRIKDFVRSRICSQHHQVLEGHERRQRRHGRSLQLLAQNGGDADDEDQVEI